MPLILDVELAPEPEPEVIIGDADDDSAGKTKGRKEKKQRRKGGQSRLDPEAGGSFEVEATCEERELPMKRSSCSRCIRSFTSEVLLCLFNLAAFFVCGVIVAGQVAAWEQFDVNSPELVVLGTTILGLAVVSLIGLHGTCKKEQHRLRLCVLRTINFSLSEAAR